MTASTTSTNKMAGSSGIKNGETETQIREDDDRAILRSIHSMCSSIQSNFKVMNDRINSVELATQKNRTIITQTHKEILKEHEAVYKRLNAAEAEIQKLKASKTADPNRRQTLILSGLNKESQNEAEVRRIFLDLGVTLNGSIKVSTLQNNKAAVQFSAFWDKNAVYKARTKLSANNRGVFINENLSPEEAKIFFLARAAKKQNLIHNAWTRDGVTFISKIVAGNTQVATIHTEATIQELVPKFKAPQEKKPRTGKESNQVKWTGGDHQPQAKTPTVKVPDLEPGEIPQETPETAESSPMGNPGHSNDFPTSSRRVSCGKSQPENSSANLATAEKAERTPETTEAQESQDGDKPKTKITKATRKSPRT